MFFLIFDRVLPVYIAQHTLNDAFAAQANDYSSSCHLDWWSSVQDLGLESTFRQKLPRTFIYSPQKSGTDLWYSPTHTSWENLRRSRRMTPLTPYSQRRLSGLVLYLPMQIHSVHQCNHRVIIQCPRIKKIF